MTIRLEWVAAVVDLAPAFAQLEDLPVPRGVDHEVCAACHDVECTGRCDIALWIVRQVIEDVVASGMPEALAEIIEEIEGTKLAARYQP